MLVVLSSYPLNLVVVVVRVSDEGEAKQGTIVELCTRGSVMDGKPEG